MSGEFDDRHSLTPCTPKIDNLYLPWLDKIPNVLFIDVYLPMVQLGIFINILCLNINNSQSLYLLTSEKSREVEWLKYIN